MKTITTPIMAQAICKKTIISVADKLKYLYQDIERAELITNCVLNIIPRNYGYQINVTHEMNHNKIKYISNKKSIDNLYKIVYGFSNMFIQPCNFFEINFNEATATFVGKLPDIKNVYTGWTSNKFGNLISEAHEVEAFNEAAYSRINEAIAQVTNLRKTLQS